MSKDIYPLKLPASVRAAATRLARADGVSLNEWIASAVAQKVGAVETAAGVLQRLSAGATPADLRRFLDAAPDVPSPPEDRLEESPANTAEGTRRDVA